MFSAWGQKDPRYAGPIYLHQAETSLGRAIRIFEIPGGKKRPSSSPNVARNHPIMRQIPGRPIRRRRSSYYIGKTSLANEMPAGEWYQAAALYILILPDDEENEELNFETINYLYAFSHSIAEENNGKVIREQNGFMVIYGAPVAHEDDSEQAVNSAIQIINFYSEISVKRAARYHPDWNCTGKNHCGWNQVPLLIMKWSPAGEPIQLAKKLAELAGSARVLVSAPVRNITSYRYEYTSASSHDLEKLARMTVYQLEGLREQILPIRGLIGLTNPFCRPRQRIQCHSGIE